MTKTDDPDELVSLRTLHKLCLWTTNKMSYSYTVVAVFLTVALASVIFWVFAPKENQTAKIATAPVTVGAATRAATRCSTDSGTDGRRGGSGVS
ncbi:hypothetical protein ACU8KH_06122 [Lachancea thermotolerans]